LSDALRQLGTYVIRRQVKLASMATWSPDQKRDWVATSEARDFAGAWRVLDSVEGIRRPFEPPVPVEAIASCE
jgi:hypothetical protein